MQTILLLALITFVLHTIILFLLIAVLKRDTAMKIVFFKSLLLAFILTFTGLIATKTGMPGRIVGSVINLIFIMSILGYDFFAALLFTLFLNIFYGILIYPYLLHLLNG